MASNGSIHSLQDTCKTSTQNFSNQCADRGNFILLNVKLKFGQNCKNGELSSRWNLNSKLLKTMCWQWELYSVKCLKNFLTQYSIENIYTDINVTILDWPNKQNVNKVKLKVPVCKYHNWFSYDRSIDPLESFMFLMTLEF